MRKYLVTEDEFKSATVNEDGDFTLTRDNGEVIPVGNIRGPEGPAGPNTVPTYEAIGQALSEDGPVKDQLNATFVVRRVHLIGLWGQSNMSGRGADYSAFKDPEHPRIKQFGSGSTAITPANEPLDMHDMPSGIGPGMQFARQYLRTLSDDDIVLLVPSAHGGTPLVSSATLAWRWGVSGNLSAQAVAQMEAAITAAEAEWPGSTVQLEGILWFQGETDSSATNMVSGAAYEADLDALISGVRTHFSMPTLPFVLAQFIPEAMGVGTRVGVDIVQSETPYRVAHTGFAVAPPEGYSNGDALHANAMAHRRFYGPRMFDEFARIRAGIAPTSPVSEPPPGTVVFSDDFDRADGPLGATPIGGLTWALAGSSPQILSNQLAIPGPTSATAAVDAGRGNGRFAFTLAVAGDCSGQTLFRALPESMQSNHLMLSRESSASRVWALWKRVDNTPMLIHATSTPIADGDEVIVEMEGESVVITVNHAQLWSGVVPELANTGTAYGARAVGSFAMRWDSISLETI